MITQPNAALNYPLTSGQVMKPTIINGAWVRRPFILETTSTGNRQDRKITEDRTNG